MKINQIGGRLSIEILWSHDYIDPLVAQLQNFKDVILNNSEPLVTASEGAKSLKVIEAIHESISKN
jgi:predicted dehydrogenase